MKNKKIKSNIRRIYASTMLIMLVGVFLLPQYALASSISDENIIKLTNEIRAKQGLEMLSANQLLTKAAYDKAEAIFETQEFKHNLEGKKFSTWVKDTGYDYQNVGENLAIDFVTSEGTMEAWLNSPSHKENLINPKFEEIGVAIKKDTFEGHDSLLVVQIFGKQNPKAVSTVRQVNTNIVNETKPSELDDPMFMGNASPKTMLIAGTKNINLANAGNQLQNFKLYGQEYLSMEYLEQTVLYIIDYTNVYMMNYYYTVIALLLLVFSSSYIWHRRTY